MSTRERRGPSLRPDRSGEGFTLLETLVSMAVISMVMLTTTTGFVMVQSKTRLLGEQQVATGLVKDLLSELQAIPYQSMKTRTGYPLDDPAAAGLAGVVKGTTFASGTVDRTSSSRAYHLTWFASDCLATTCDLTSTANVPTVQLAVAASWPAKECRDTGGRCLFVTSTLINPLSSTSAGVVVLPTATPTGTAPPPTPPAAIWVYNRFSVVAGAVNVTGPIHSNDDIVFSAVTGVVGPRIEYSGSYNKDISAIALLAPAAVKVPPSVAPEGRNFADYRPGGSEAVAAGSSYKAISCASGSTWIYNAMEVAGASIVYVPCNVSFLGAAVVSPLVAAEGTMSILGGAVIGDNSRPYATGLLTNSNSASAISLVGAVSVFGNVQAKLGTVTLNAAVATFRCGILADKVTVFGFAVSITTDSGCIE